MGSPKRKSLTPTKIQAQEADLRAPGAKEALELRWRLDDLTRLVSDWVWETDRDFRLTYVSERVMEVLGLLPLELVGKSLLDLGTFPTQEEESSGINWRSPFRDAPFETRDRDGNQRMFLISGMPVFDPETGDFSGVRGIAENVTERVIAEEALRRSEERFRRMFEDAAAGMMLGDLDGWLRQVNSALCEMLGYAEDELLGLTVFDITHPDDHEATRKARHALLSGEARSIHLEKRYRRKDGNTLWGQVTGSLIGDAGGKPQYILGQVVDITEQKRTEELIQESEYRFRGMFENSGIGTAMIEKDGHYLMVNQALCNLFGRSEHEMLGMTSLDFTHPDDREASERRIREFWHGDTDYYNIEKRYLRNDGQIIWGMANLSLIRDATGNPLNSILQVQDITEQKRAEAALRESEARLILSLKSARIGTYYWNIRDDTHFWDDRMHEIWGLEPGTYQGIMATDFLKSLHPDDLERVQEEITRALDDDAEYDIEYRIVRPDKGIRHVHDLAAVNRDEQGQPVRLIGVCLDISERKLNEEALKEARDGLERMVEQRTQELSKSRALFASLLNNSPTMISLKDPGDRYLMVNPAWLRTFGLGEIEVIGKTPAEVLPETHLESSVEHDREIFDSKKTTIKEHEARLADGIHHFLGVKFPVLDGNGDVEAIGSIATDITEIKRAEDARRESDEHLRLITDSLPALIVYLDRDERYLSVNETCAEWYGLPREDIIGKRVDEIHSPSEYKKFKSRLKAVLSGEATAFEETVNYRDGIIRNVHVSYVPDRASDGSVRGFIALAQDTSERKRAEEALRESEEKFRDIAVTASDRFWEMDENLRFTSFIDYPGSKISPALKRFIGRTRWEAAGADPDNDEKWRRHREDHLARRPYRGFEFFLPGDDAVAHHLIPISFLLMNI